MSTELLDRLQENKLRGLEELVDSCQAATALGSGPDQAAALADAIVDEGIGVRQGLLRLWDYHWMMALAGEIVDRRADGAKLQSLLERGGRVLASGAAIARACVDLSGQEVARLAQYEEQTRVFPLWVEECLARWEMLEAPRKPLDRERLARSRAAYERGECEDLATIIARLEQGGSLLKE
jgi:hypothetical protein